MSEAVSASAAAGDGRTFTANLIVAARRPSLTWRAFFASRLLVLLAGAAGVLTVTKHVGTGVTGAFAHQLGPVGYVLSGSAFRFDSAFYTVIAAHGYAAAGPDSTAFYPLYPFSIRALGLIVGSGRARGSPGIGGLLRRRARAAAQADRA